ncbi:endoribonuclease YbeY isoform X1 [Bombina bombina]|uniref:endoribonuclease YbeY isoform X1 n=1 Tax=Bombina bombina TaxID=8345 RepID=UPI00235AFE0B|nr:endoribonuclease YbeY isoform X1 [Bombina bombina]
MSLIVRNAQRLVPLRRALLRHHLEAARSFLNVQNFDLGVICVNNKRIQQINRLYREQDSATDVLSFPFHEVPHPGVVPIPQFRDEYNLGDIYLGIEFIYQQCHENQEDYSNILTVTAIHGLCHLLGYKHNSTEKCKQMYEKENDILTAINRLTGTNLKPLTTKQLESQPH